MKKHYLAFVALAAAAVATSCSTDELAQLQEQNPSESQTVTLTASVDGNNDVTRVGMTKNEDGKSASFYWHKDDKIFVQTKSGETFSGAEFSTTAKDGATSATFTGEVTGTVGQYAVYPYNENHKFTNESNKTKLTYNLPAEYNEYTPESKIFGTTEDYPSNSTNMPMLGTIDNGKISFKPIGGLAVIRIDAMPAEEGTITVTADQQLCGNFTVEDLSASEAQIATPSTTTATDNSVTFTFSDATADEVGVFYLPLATGKYTNVKITVAYNSLTQTISYASLDVARKSVTAIPLYNVNGALSKPIDDNVYYITAQNNGVNIYYCKFNHSDKIELAVTYPDSDAENYSGEVTIPASVEVDGTTYPVTAIGDDAFGSCSGLTSIVIPAGVTSIGSGAFYGCSKLTSINIPDGVTSIGIWAFYNCKSLTSINIPDGVTSIGYAAFYKCSGLTSIEIPNSVTSIGYAAFGDCTQLASVTIGSGVKTIEKQAFANCPLTSVTIPNSVTSIGYMAFSGCKLASVTIGSGVETIGKEAFAYCPLTSIEIPNSVTSIGYAAFWGCTKLKSVTIGSGVKTIGQQAFYSTAIETLYVYATTPPDIDSDTLPYTYSYTSAGTQERRCLSVKLYVPSGSMDAYKAKEYWKDYNFTSIEGLSQ